jgi:hypothetical protein
MKKNHLKISSLEILKRRATREMIILLNNLAILLYPLGSKFLALDARHMWKK